MARFCFIPTPSMSPRMPLAAPPFFSNRLIPLARGGLFSGDEEQEARQRNGYPVTPQFSLSGLLPAGKKPKSVQKTAPPW
jgi:hypothetical protein